jgi:Delta3-Delta2-enoyl-CoA isomerase
MASSSPYGTFRHIRLAPPADADGVVVLTLAREPVNTMDRELWGELAAALDALEAAHAAGLRKGGGGGGGGSGGHTHQPSTSSSSSSSSSFFPRALVIESGLTRDVFTAGNDIRELYAPGTSAARYTEFWVAQNTFLSRLLVSPLATVAAVRGACPAGGCALALCCDVRLMLEGRGAVIGLNEVALGIPVPKMWGALLARVVGKARAEGMCMGATLLPPARALEVGLIDALVRGDAGDLRAAGVEAARRLARAGPDAGRAATKANARGAFADDWAAYAPVEAAGAWAMLESEATVRALKRVMDGLAAKKARM